MDRPMLDLLYRSFDDTLSEEEQRRLDETLDRSTALRAEYERLTRMRRAISDSAPVSFGPWFVARVMRDIAAAAAPAAELFFETLFSAFRRVAFAAAIAVIAIVAYNLAQSDTLSLTATFGLYEPTLEEMLDVTVALESEGGL